MSATGAQGEDRAKALRFCKHPKFWENLRAEDGARRYALKYALKPHQKIVPQDYRDVGRFWGCSRDVSRSANEVIWESGPITEWDARRLCEAKGRDMSGWEDLPKYVYLFD